MTIREHSAEIGIFAGAVLVIGCLTGVGIYATMAEIKQWETFKAAHDCRVVSKVQGNTMSAITYGINGQASTGVMFTPEKTGWLCSDGITYYR